MSPALLNQIYGDVIIYINSLLNSCTQATESTVYTILKTQNQFECHVLQSLFLLRGKGSCQSKDITKIGVKRITLTHKQ